MTRYTLTACAKEKAAREHKIVVRVSSHAQARRLSKRLTGWEWFGPVSLGSKTRLFLVADTPENRRVLQEVK